MRAIFNDTVVADSDETVEVEGNQYFPHGSLREELFSASDTHTTCPWKGEASYLSLEGHHDAAWFYPEPKDAAAEIRNHVAFDKRVVQVVD